MAALTPRSTIRLCTLALGVALAPPALAGDVSVKLDAGTGFSIKNSTGTVERLRVDEATGNISRNGALFVHTTGTNNTFVGVGAGNTATTGYGGNSAFGYAALRANTTGFRNSAVGNAALFSNTTGTGNSAVGTSALILNTTGNYNSAVGISALYSNTTGRFNSAVGSYALAVNSTGNYNVAVGRDAGFYQTTGSDNIYLANTGVAGESGQIKIGTVGTHTRAHVAGIHGNTSAGGIAVLVNASGTLGTTTSSARFKQDVRDIGEASDFLMKLRPVTFRYREDAVGAEEAKATQYGLIAEEVAEVAPELVAPDADGKPYSVKYHELPALLLNEVQEQQRTIEKQASVIETQRLENQAQQREIAALTTRLARLEAHAR